MRFVWAIIASIAILMVFSIIKVFYSTVVGAYKEEHINELSKEVYVALGVSEIIPLIIAVILIKIVWKKITYKEPVEIDPNSKNKSLESKDTINNSNPSFTKAVYNHTKDIASDIKPTINEYKEKHQTTKTNTSNISYIDEDEIYEKVMIEIEEDKKVKSTWAKALAHSDGDKEKAEAIYIQLRVKTINEEKLNQISNNISHSNTNRNAARKEVKLNTADSEYKKLLKEEEEKVFGHSNNQEKYTLEDEEEYDMKYVFYGIFIIVGFAIAISFIKSL